MRGLVSATSFGVQIRVILTCPRIQLFRRRAQQRLHHLLPERHSVRSLEASNVVVVVVIPFCH